VIMLTLREYFESFDYGFPCNVLVGQTHYYGNVIAYLVLIASMWLVYRTTRFFVHFVYVDENTTQQQYSCRMRPKLSINHFLPSAYIYRNSQQ
jgi:hypothetical protein